MSAMIVALEQRESGRPWSAIDRAPNLQAQHVTLEAQAMAVAVEPNQPPHRIEGQLRFAAGARAPDATPRPVITVLDRHSVLDLLDQPAVLVINEPNLR